MRPEHGAAEAAGEHLAGDGVDIPDGHRLDVFERAGQAAVLAEVQFTAAQVVHPGGRVLQAEQ